MSRKVKCPNCKTEHEVADEDPPEFIVCACGARLRLRKPEPEAPAPLALADDSATDVPGPAQAFAPVAPSVPPAPVKRTPTARFRERAPDAWDRQRRKEFMGGVAFLGVLALFGVLYWAARPRVRLEGPEDVCELVSEKVSKSPHWKLYFRHKTGRTLTRRSLVHFEVVPVPLKDYKEIGVQNFGHYGKRVYSVKDIVVNTVRVTDRTTGQKQAWSLAGDNQEGPVVMLDKIALSLMDAHANEHPVFVDHLIQTVRDGEGFLREHAVELVCKRTESDAALDALIVALADKNRNVRMMVIKALPDFGAKAKKAVSALKVALDDPNPDVRREAARVLEAIGGKPPAPRK